ncbi:MAG: hypothetical protein ACD_57C00259G0004 [uncultured bacterium]|nr:MAG: hypothetical protein ACD_57C00259G0004 [uncultured bacterium]
MPERSEIIIGGIYQHSGRRDHQYEVMGVYPDASYFEETRETAGETVVYRQLYDGGFPKGTIWTREAGDFCSTTEVRGREIKKFKLVC